VRRLLLVVIFACIWSTRACPQEISVKDILLYAPFDGSADARVARGLREAVTHGKLQFEKGVIGKALVVGSRKTWIGFELKKNIDYEKGTIAFWVAPLDWDYTTRRSRSFIHAKAYEELQIYYYFGSSSVFTKFGFEDGSKVVEDFRCGKWKKGQWKHIVLTWEPSRVAVYCDSYLKAALTKDISFPRAIGPILYMGKFPELSKDAFTYRNDTLIDEFYIFNRPLTVAEMHKLMKRGKAKKESEQSEKEGE